MHSLFILVRGIRLGGVSRKIFCAVVLRVQATVQLSQMLFFFFCKSASSCIEEVASGSPGCFAPWAVVILCGEVSSCLLASVLQAASHDYLRLPI